MQQPKRPHSVDSPKTARAEIILSPTPPPTKMAATQSPFDSVIQPSSQPQAFKPFQPQDSDLLRYIQEQDHRAPVHEPMDAPDAADINFRPSPTQRPSTQELIAQGIEPQPQQEDMFDRENPRPPKFKTHIKPQLQLKENDAAYFECRLIPIGDPDMVVEWYKDGQPLTFGSRFRTTYDFGYVALEILWTLPEDSGLYVCHARNNQGEDVTQAQLFSAEKESVITDTQLPDDSGVQRLNRMEEQIRRDRIGKERMEEGPEPSAPVFDLMPEAAQVEEGDTAKFLCKVGGHPRPRLTWWINGTILVNGNRFRLGYDGMINFLEIPKVREYDAGTVRVMAKNPLGEAECSTTLVVLPREDWRSRLKQAPKSTVEVELGKHKSPETRSMELQHALKKPRTTVTELRAFERSAQEKALTFKDDEVKQAFYAINLQHAQMQRTDVDARGYEPHMKIGTDVHIDRAKHLIGMEHPVERDDLHAGVARSGRTHEPPTFSKPLMNAKAKEGHIVKMEVGFSGFPYPEIQWFREGIEIKSSDDFRITTLNNKSFLLIKEVFVEDAGLFTVRSTNQFGMAECKGALTVTEDPYKQREMAPEFNVQMRDLSIKVGQPVTLDVEIIGHPKPEIYWTKNGQRLGTSARWKFIVEENHFTMLIYEARMDDQGTYECVVINKLGKATCSSTLTVIGRAELPRAAAQPTTKTVVAPELVQPMKDQHVNEGEGATFQCHISATPDPVIHWYHNNTLIKPSKYFHMQSRDGIHTLHIAGAFPEDEGIYKCTARNQEGEVTCIAHLKVLALSSEPEPEAFQQMSPPQYLKPISATEVKPGEQAHFVAEFGGQPVPQVTWYREGIQIMPSDDFQILQDGNKCVLFIREVFPEDSGVFTCRATNPAGIAECSAQLHVTDVQQVSTAQLQFRGPPKAKPQILKAPSPQREMPEGNTAKLMVHLASNPPPRFSWFYNGRQIQQSQRFKITYEEEIVTLFIYNVQPQDSGEYMLRAANELGEVTCRTVLNIKPSQKTVQVPMQSARQVTLQSTQKETVPVFTRPLPPEIRVREKTIAKLEAFIDAYPTPSITWHVNGSQIRPSPKYTVKHEGNKAILLVKNVTVEDSGTYMCKARSDLGEAATSTTVYVTGSQPRTEPPRFVLPLKNAQTLDGQQVTLRCRVQGIPIPEVNWFLNDKNIDKNEDYLITYDRSTGNVELHIADCLMEDSGVFKCVARNAAGQDVTMCQLQVLAGEDQQQQTQVQRVHAPPKTKAVVQKGDREVVKQVAESELDRTLHHKDVKVVKKIVKKQSGQPPKFTKPIQPQVVKEGEDASFTAVVSGAPQPDIIWLKDKVEIRPSNKYQMSMDVSGTCSLRILFAQPGDVGVYSCRAENPAGKATCTANVVVVHPESKFTTHPDLHMVPPSFTVGLKTVQAAAGQDILWPFHTEGKPMPTLVVYHNGRKVKLGHRMNLRFGRESGSWELSLPATIPHDSGVIRITATNPRGEAVTEAKLMVTGALPFSVRDSHKIQYIQEEPERPHERKPYVPVFSEPPQVYETYEAMENEYSTADGNLDQRPAREGKYKPQFEVTEESVTDTHIRSEHEIAREDRTGNKSYDKNVFEQHSTLEERVDPHLYIEGEEESGVSEDPLAIQLHEEQQGITLERYPGDPSVQKFSTTTQDRKQAQSKETKQPMTFAHHKGVSQDGMLEVSVKQGQAMSEKQTGSYVKSTKTDVQIRDTSTREEVDLTPDQPQIMAPPASQGLTQVRQKRRKPGQPKPPPHVAGQQIIQPQTQQGHPQQVHQQVPQQVPQQQQQVHQQVQQVPQKQQQVHQQVQQVSQQQQQAHQQVHQQAQPAPPPVQVSKQVMVQKPIQVPQQTPQQTQQEPLNQKQVHEEMRQGEPQSVDTSHGTQTHPHEPEELRDALAEVQPVSEEAVQPHVVEKPQAPPGALPPSADDDNLPPSPPEIHIEGPDGPPMSQSEPELADDEASIEAVEEDHVVPMDREDIIPELNYVAIIEDAEKQAEDIKPSEGTAEPVQPPEQVGKAPEQASTAPEQVGKAPEQVGKAPEQASTAPKQVDKAPEQASTASEQASTAPEQVNQVSEQASTASEQASTADPQSTTQAVSAKPQPAAQPVSADPQPVSADPQPVSAEPEPVSADPQPVSTDPQPVSAEPQPAAAHPVQAETPGDQARQVVQTISKPDQKEQSAEHSTAAPSTAATTVTNEAPPTPSEAPPTPSKATPASSEAPPTPSQAPPAHSEAPPTPCEAPPASNEAPPASNEAPPASSEAPPTPSEAPPIPSEAPPTPSEAPPTPSEAPPTPSEAPPASSEALPTPSEAPPTSNEAPPPSNDTPTVPEQATT